EIAKHFDPEEEGYEVVEEAIYTMTGVAWYINDMKRKHEHAVRLQCSTLMLIESAKDSLCFSVTHYKHPKQPHSVQVCLQLLARTMEEKKLWAHHIKRLILENHQAVIPQKVCKGSNLGDGFDL
ncbi:hypothetical protein cypCar_00040203, partial [Cyprinus carpio]